MLFEYYSKSTLSSLRFGLKQHFKATHGFDIINNSEFTDANKVFGAKCVDLKHQGLAKVEHKLPICKEGIKKLYESTAFFFQAMLYFCRRGRQKLCQLKKTDFSFNTDSTRARYVCKSTGELTKNRWQDDESFNGGLMYEKPGPNCPVVSFELYLSHLNPLNEFLFQRPRGNASTSEDLWYDDMVVGERTVGQKMKNISREAKLPKCNTNHSIRVTAVTILDKSGFEARHIMAIRGHKNEASIQSYSKTGISTKMMSRPLLQEASLVRSYRS